MHTLFLLECLYTTHESIKFRILIKPYYEVVPMKDQEAELKYMLIIWALTLFRWVSELISSQWCNFPAQTYLNACLFSCQEIKLTSVHGPPSISIYIWSSKLAQIWIFIIQEILEIWDWVWELWDTEGLGCLLEFHFLIDQHYFPILIFTLIITGVNEHNSRQIHFSMIASLKFSWVLRGMLLKLPFWEFPL